MINDKNSIATNELIEGIKMKFCECMDIHHYWEGLLAIEEKYIETLELYEFEEWLIGTDKSINYSLANEKLAETIEAFCSLYNEKAMQFCHLIEQALNNKDNITLTFLFNNSNTNIDDVEEFIRKLEDALFYLNDYYSYNVEEQITKISEFMNFALGM